MNKGYLIDDVSIATSKSFVTTTPLTWNAGASPSSPIVNIPANTIITSEDDDWDGVVNPPQVITGYQVPKDDGLTSMAIAVGSNTHSLILSQAAKLVFPGEAGKRVGFLAPEAGSEFTEIKAVCNSLSSPTVGAGGACKINDGDNLVVWTKHFTVFATYTTTVSEKPPVRDGQPIENEQDSISPLRGQGALTSAAIAVDSTSDDEGNVLGTDTKDGSPQADKVAALAPSEDGWKLWGIAWYWYLLALGAVGAGTWYGIRRYRGPAEF